jgi:type II secretory pathway component GspD/PulD (secretin)
VAKHTTTIGRAFGGLCLTALLTTAAALAQDFGSPRMGPVAMIEKARDHYAKYEYDAAAQLYQQAYALKDLLTPNQRGDLGTLMQQTATAQKTRQDGILLIEQAEYSVKVSKAGDAEAYARLAQANQFLSPTDKQRIQVAMQGASRLRSQAEENGKGDPSAMLVRARDAMRRGDFDTAETLARQAEKSRSLMSNLAFWGDTPTKVLDDVRAMRARMPGGAPQALNPNGAQSIANYTPLAAAPGSDRKAQAKSIVMEGYKALEANNFEQAKALANQAKELRAELEWWEPNPDKLLADVGRRAAANDVVATSNDPVEILRQARSYYLQQRYDEAEKLAAKAESLSRHWGLLFGDSPKKLRDDIARGRNQLDADQAAKLTVEARRQLQKSNYAEARNLAVQAKRLGHSSAILNPWTDTPDNVLRDVARLEKLHPLPASPVAPFPNDIAQAGMGGALEPAHVREQNRSKAVTLLMEARMLERQDRLPEARGKVIEAQKLFTQWSPVEESPSAVLRDLDTKAAARVKSLLNQATEIVAKNPADSTRFQKADNYLVIARRLAEAFQQDTRPIDQKVHWLQLAASQSRNDAVAMVPLQSAQRKNAGFDEQSEPIEPAAKLGHEDALKKLEQARLELRAGNTASARRFAEDAFSAPTARAEAQAVLRSIDAEEHAQTIVAAQRSFQAGMDAYKHKDYRKAAGILANIDVRLLQPEQARRVGEVIDSPDMRVGLKPVGAQAPVLPDGPPSLTNAPPSLDNGPPLNAPPAVANAPPANAPMANAPPGQSTASDLDDPRLVQARQMQKIQAEKFRDMKRAAETKALQLAAAGHENKAIDILQDYQVKLKESGLEDVHARSLNHAVEERIQKLRTTWAQKEIERERKQQTGSKFDEGARVEKQNKIQEKVAELVNRGSQRYREGKYDEAIAEAQKAKDLDNENRAADALINLSILRKGEESSRVSRQNTEDFVMNSLNMDHGKNIPTYIDPLRANKNITAYNQAYRKDYSRQGLTTLSAKEMFIERKLKEPITLDFQDVPLYRVVQDLSILSGLDIHLDRRALNEENISLEQPLSLRLTGVSLKSALNLLLDQVKLTYVISEEVLKITTPSGASGKRRVVTYSVADLVVPVEDQGTSEINSFEQALRRHIATTGGGIKYNQPVPAIPTGGLQNGPIVSQNTPNGGGGWSQTKSSTRNTTENVLKNLIENIIRPNTWESSGGEGRIQYYDLGHVLVVSQVQEVQEEVFALLQALRRLQDIQISIEMRIVSVSEKFFERIGLDFDVNIKTPQYRQENQLINGSFGGPFNINRNLNVGPIVSGLTPAGTLTPDLNVPIKASSFEFSAPPFGGFPGTLGGDGGLALGLAFLSDIQVFMFLEAAQGDQRTHIMQAPKLTVFNGQTANISVNDQQFFITGVSVAQAGAQTFFVPQNQPFPTGVGMQVTPVVSADRRFVRLNLTPQITSLISANIPLIPVQIPLPQLFDAPNGAGFIAGQPVIFQMFFQQPAFTIINLQTTVNVPDGGTVLLGGLKTLAEGRNEFGPPFLSKIPYISRLFRNQAFGREAQSIMILVTPRIIINEEIEAEILGQQPPIPRQ